VGGTLDPDTGESLQVELSETRSDRVATPPHPPRSPLEPRYAPRQRMLRLVGVTGAVVLAVAGLLHRPRCWLRLAATSSTCSPIRPA